MAYTRYWQELDDDIWYMRSLDGGISWSPANCISCLEVDNERSAGLETSLSLGAFHAAFWHDFGIDYATADHSSPAIWTVLEHINKGGSGQRGLSPPGGWDQCDAPHRR